MLLDLSDIARVPGSRASFAFCEELPASESEEDDFSLASPVEGSLTVTNGGSLLVVRGELHTKVKLSCSRCLEEFEQSLDADLSEAFSIDPSVPRAERQTVDAEAPGEAAFRENELDLTELLRQLVLLELPLRAVCREDCLGLCARCGRNRNRGECHCPPEETEGPFAGLRDLLPGAPGEAGPGPEVRS